MVGLDGNIEPTKKRIKPSERPFTTALFLLRCIELGISLSDLDELTVGMVYDIFTEKSNDSVEWDTMATAEDIDNF